MFLVTANNSITIQEEASALPVQERAKLIERLLESLDTLPELEAEALWLDVAERRAREIDENKVQLVTPEELESRNQARLR
jgi:putative addiction module component (TIGR02574 family)